MNTITRSEITHRHNVVMDDPDVLDGWVVNGVWQREQPTVCYLHTHMIDNINHVHNDNTTRGL